jgi:hypothetical protein
VKSPRFSRDDERFMRRALADQLRRGLFYVVDAPQIAGGGV